MSWRTSRNTAPSTSDPGPSAPPPPPPSSTTTTTTVSSGIDYSSLPGVYSKYVAYLPKSQSGAYLNPDVLAKDVEGLQDRIRYRDEMRGIYGRKVSELHSLRILAGKDPRYAEKWTPEKEAELAKFTDLFSQTKAEVDLAKKLNSELIGIRVAFGGRIPDPADPGAYSSQGLPVRTESNAPAWDALFRQGEPSLDFSPVPHLQYGTASAQAHSAFFNQGLDIMQAYNPGGLNRAFQAGEGFSSVFAQEREIAVNERIRERNVQLFRASAVGDLMQAGFVHFEGDRLFLTPKGQALGSEKLYALEESAIWGQSLDFVVQGRELQIYDQGARAHFAYLGQGQTKESLASFLLSPSGGALGGLTFAPPEPERTPLPSLTLKDAEGKTVFQQVRYGPLGVEYDPRDPEQAMLFGDFGRYNTPIRQFFSTDFSGIVAGKVKDFEHSMGFKGINLPGLGNVGAHTVVDILGDVPETFIKAPLATGYVFGAAFRNVQEPYTDESRMRAGNALYAFEDMVKLPFAVTFAAGMTGEAKLLASGLGGVPAAPKAIFEAKSFQSGILTGQLSRGGQSIAYVTRFSPSLKDYSAGLLSPITSTAAKATPLFEIAKSGATYGAMGSGIQASFEVSVASFTAYQSKHAKALEKTLSSQFPAHGQKTIFELGETPRGAPTLISNLGLIPAVGRMQYAAQKGLESLSSPDAQGRIAFAGFGGAVFGASLGTYRQFQPAISKSLGVAYTRFGDLAQIPRATLASGANFAFVTAPQQARNLYFLAGSPRKALSKIDSPSQMFNLETKITRFGLNPFEAIKPPAPAITAPPLPRPMKISTISSPKMGISLPQTRVKTQQRAPSPSVISFPRITPLPAPRLSLTLPERLRQRNEEKVIDSLRQEQRLGLFQAQNLRSLQGLGQRIGQKQVALEKIGQFPLLNIGQMQKLSQMVGQKQRFREPPPKLVPPMALPTFTFAFNDELRPGKKKKKPSRTTRGYSPSLIGLEIGKIEQGLQNTYSGFEVRGILKRRRG